MCVSEETVELMFEQSTSFWRDKILVLEAELERTKFMLRGNNSSKKFSPDINSTNEQSAQQGSQLT